MVIVKRLYISLNSPLNTCVNIYVYKRLNLMKNEFYFFEITIAADYFIEPLNYNNEK